MTHASSSILVIDQTLREGMQFRGIVFSPEQRLRILEFQENLGVDICQAGYPPALPWEAEQVRDLNAHALARGFSVRVAGMGRSLVRDADVLAATGIRDFHLHAHIPADSGRDREQEIFREIGTTLAGIRQSRPDAVISLAMLDVGRTPVERLLSQAEQCIRELSVDILSLPDTSGFLAPNQIFDKIRPMALTAAGTGTRISVHCHNDMGMASANSVMGILAGASVLEVSALGIGERNGLADLFTTARMLRDQGFAMNLRTSDEEGFREYYAYVNAVVREQTGEDLFTYTTPFFGKAVSTHVAGTHADTAFGISGKETFALNLLCGRHLVEKCLKANGISHDPGDLGRLTRAVKSASARLCRSITPQELAALAAGPGDES